MHAHVGQDGPTPLPCWHRFSVVQASVGELVCLSAERARRSEPGIGLGVASEHAYYEDSVRLFCQAGFNYVSCLSASLPVALLVAAQAVIAEEDAALKRNGLTARG